MELQITADLPRKNYEKKWQFCVGSCHASTLLRRDAIELLKRVHEELGIKRVRCHGIFNDDLGTVTRFSQIFGLPMGEHITEYNFYKVGLVYDNLLSIGMQPFVELSFMPEALAADPTRSFIYGSITSMPQNIERWKDYIRAFLTYLFHRYGEEEVKQWYFEVWNEPDLVSTFYEGNQMDYFRFYEETARAIKEFCPCLRVGGPASSASKWIDIFVDYCREHRVPLDFVSTHQYVGEPFIGVKEEEEACFYDEKEKKQQKKEAEENLREQQKAFLKKLPPDTSILSCLRQMFGGTDATQRKDMDAELLPKNAVIVKEQAKGLPVFYTEWNMSASFGAYSQDTRKVAAYDVRTSLAMEDLVDGNSIWCYSDIFEELHQFKEPFHGGYGLMTYHGIPKPVYHGMRMLADAKKSRIALDISQFTEIEAAAFEDETEIQVLLFRQNLYQSDEPKETARVFVELTEHPERVYLQRIDENHCNPLKIWEEMGKPNDLTKKEAEYIMESSKMENENLDYTYTDGKAVMEIKLGVNDLYFLRIEKKAEEEKENEKRK